MILSHWQLVAVVVQMDPTIFNWSFSLRKVINFAQRNSHAWTTHWFKPPGTKTYAFWPSHECVKNLSFFALIYSSKENVQPVFPAIRSIWSLKPVNRPLFWTQCILQAYSKIDHGYPRFYSLKWTWGWLGELVQPSLADKKRKNKPPLGISAWNNGWFPGQPTLKTYFNCKRPKGRQLISQRRKRTQNPLCMLNG